LIFHKDVYFGIFKSEITSSTSVYIGSGEKPNGLCPTRLAVKQRRIEWSVIIGQWLSTLMIFTTRC